MIRLLEFIAEHVLSFFEWLMITFQTERNITVP